MGTGWTLATARELKDKLKKLEVDRSPFELGSTKQGRWSRRVAGTEHWVKPVLVAEVAFAEWTPEGHLRHASFQGLREDKPATSVVREKAVEPPSADEADASAGETDARPADEADPARKAPRKASTRRDASAKATANAPDPAGQDEGDGPTSRGKASGKASTNATTGAATKTEAGSDDATDETATSTRAAASAKAAKTAARRPRRPRNPRNARGPQRPRSGRPRRTHRY